MAVVRYEWGGSESAAIAKDPRSNIFQFFDGSSPNPKMSQEELDMINNLLAYMEDEFGVVLEDNSERDLKSMIQSWDAEMDGSSDEDEGDETEMATHQRTW